MHLVINLGLKSIRGIVYNDIGRKMISNNIVIKTHINNNHVEQDPKEYILKLKKILDFFSKKKITPKLKTISVTSSANCLMGLSKNLTPLTKVYTVLDFRANNIYTDGDTKKGKLLDPSHNLTKIIWQKKNNIMLFKKCKYWINSSDYLSLFFTGQLVTDSLNYNKFIFKSANLSKKILKSNGINNINLPAKLKIGKSLDITQSIIRKYKINLKCKFIITTYDAICACLGSSNPRNIYNNAAEVSGTVTSIRVICKKKPKKIGTLKVSYIPLIDRYLIGLSNNFGGGIVEWYKNFFIKKNYYQELKKSYLKGSNYFYFFPFIFGDRDMGFHQTSRGVFYGLGSNANVHDLTKSVLDSAGFSSKYLFNRISKDLNSRKISSVTLSGGLSRLDFLNKIKAQLFGIKTYICRDFESTSLGCLMLILASQSKKNFDEIVKIVKLKKIKPNNEKGLKEKYNFFIDFLKKNKKIFNINHQSLIKNAHKRNL